LTRFEFATATRIVFGPGVISELASLAAAFGQHALIVTGANPDRAKAHLSALESKDVTCRYFSIPSEPTTSLIREGAQAARFAKFIIGFGGGSAIDAAKAIAAVAPNSGEPMDYLEVIGQARPLENPPLPFIAIPTTAGTGAEVTRNAVIGSPEHSVKASIRSPQMLARLALIDPDLTLDVPPSITAATGLDTITQLIEPYVSSRANTFTDIYCLDGLSRAITALPRAYTNGADANARSQMSFAALLSGLSLANAGLGVVHGFAAPLGGMTNAPHGALCAAVLPHAVTINVRALRARAPEHPSLAKYTRIAALLTHNSHAGPEDCSAPLTQLCSSLNIPTLRALGLTQSQIPVAVERAAAASSMKANPLPLTSAELTEILEHAL
jgi:alcohol dehydrogenase class IV